jgi:UDP-N-acetylmuramate--alanine ligase
VSLTDAAAALRGYEGIYRRTQVLGKKDGVWVVDDFAHNPVKCAAAIAACQPVSGKVVAWFQPHGYTPTKFLRKEFVHEISNALRDQDEIWMSEIFYAGGTAVKDISALDLINDIKALGKNAYFVEDRNQFLHEARPHLDAGTTLLLMGARDPSLEQFSKDVYNKL